jgi:hypothetical protein
MIPHGRPHPNALPIFLGFDRDFVCPGFGLIPMLSLYSRSRLPAEHRCLGTPCPQTFSRRIPIFRKTELSYVRKNRKDTAIGGIFQIMRIGKHSSTRQAIQLAIHLIDTPVMKLSAVPLRSVQYDIFSVIKLLYYYKLKA